MSAIDVLLESKRRDRTNDTWFVTEAPYALSIKGTVGPQEGDSYFVFPLGPQEMSMKRIFRQSVVGTLGGLVAEEQGLFVKDLHVSCNFGLYPKDGADSTNLIVAQKYDGSAKVIGGEKLSGPGWTRRMLRHFFDRYADLKADPAQGHNVVMCWHNFKDDEHLVVVPQEVDLNRSSSERMLYPVTLSFKAIGPADALRLPAEQLGPLGKFLQALKDAFAAVKLGLALIEAGFQEASALLGEVRYFIAIIDSVIDDVTRIASAARDFVEGIKDTLAMGAGFINSVTALLEEVLGLMEDVRDLPGEVRQSFQTALDGLHAVQAQIGPIGLQTYDQEAAEYRDAGTQSSEAEAQAAEDGPPTTAAEAETQAVGSGDAARRDAGAWPGAREFGNYAGFQPHTVSTADTMASLAARYLGNGARWYEIAALNGLKPPYISMAGIPGTVRPGATIAIPWLGDTGPGSVVGRGAQSDEALYGTDMALRETRDSRPGAPRVDLAIDPATKRDVAIVSGIPNLVQAVQMRVWTLRGTMPLYPGYGRERLLGDKIVGSTIGAARIALRSTLIRDSRIQSVGGMSITAEGDFLDFDVSVVAIGSTEPTTISTALV